MAQSAHVLETLIVKFTADASEYQNILKQVIAETNAANKQLADANSSASGARGSAGSPRSTEAAELRQIQAIKKANLTNEEKLNNAVQSANRLYQQGKISLEDLNRELLRQQNIYERNVRKQRESSDEHRRAAAELKEMYDADAKAKKDAEQAKSEATRQAERDRIEAARALEQERNELHGYANRMLNAADVAKAHADSAMHEAKANIASLETLPRAIRAQVESTAQQALSAATDSVNAAEQAAKATSAESAEAFENVARQSANMAAEHSANVNRMVADHQQFINNVLVSGHSLMIVGSQIAGIGSTIHSSIVRPLVSVGMTSILAASDAAEAGNKFSEVFGYVGAEAAAMAKQLDDSFGMSSTEAKKLMANTGDLLNAFGFTKAESAKLSLEVQKLSADLVSFSNFEGGVERASEAVTRALLGEKEMLKSLGKAILDKDVMERVALNTAKGIVFESERQAKAYATLELIQEQSKNAMGDYARTSHEFANVSRELQAELKDLAEAYGAILLPAATKVVTITKDLVTWLAELPTPVRTGIVVVGGLTTALAGLASTALIVGGTLAGTIGLTKVLLVQFGASTATISAFTGGLARIGSVAGLVVRGLTVAGSAVMGLGRIVVSFAATAIGAIGAIPALIIAIGSAAAYGAYRLSLAATGYVDAMKEAARMNEAVQTRQAKNFDAVNTRAAGITNTAEKRKFLEEEIALAELNVAGQEAQLASRKRVLEEESRTWSARVGIGSKIRAEERSEIEAAGVRLSAEEQQLQRLREMKAELDNANNSELAKFEIASGVADVEAELQKQIAIFGQLGSAAELYDLKQQGATEEQLKGIRDLDQQLQQLQRDDAASKLAEEWAMIGKTIGLSTREVAILKAELDGVSPEKIAAMRAAMATADKAEANNRASDTLKDWQRTREEIGLTTREAAILKATVENVDPQLIDALRSENIRLTVEENNQKLAESAEAWKLQARTIGMTSREAELYKLQLSEVSAEAMNAARAADAVLSQAELKNNVKQLTEDLKMQAATFGMSSAEASIYKLQLAGASDAMLEQARAAAEQVKGLEDAQKLQQEAKQLNEQNRDPMQKLRDGQTHLKKLLDEGGLSWGAYTAEMKKAEDQFRQDYTADLKVTGVEGIEAGTAEAQSRLEQYLTTRRADTMMKSIVPKIGNPQEQLNAPGPAVEAISSVAKKTVAENGNAVAVNSVGLTGGNSDFESKIITLLEAVVANTKRSKPGAADLEILKSGFGDIFNS